MLDFVLLCLPIFGVVALGWVATRSKITSATAVDVLGVFSFRFALPALLFRLVASQPLDHSFNAPFYGGYLASGGLVFALVFGFSRIINREHASTTGRSGQLSCCGAAICLTGG